MSDGSNQDGAAGDRPRASLFGRRATPRSPIEALQPQAAPPPPETPRKQRREGLSRLSGVLSFLLIAAIMGVGAFAWALREATEPGPLAADKVAVIAREDEADGATIADQLERAGVISNSMWFNLVVLADGNRGKLKRGEYLFKEHASLRDVENTLVYGKPVQHKVTIPEGWTSDQVAQRLRSDDALVGDLRELPREGSILPDTYFFERGETREALIARMEKAQAKFVDDVWKGRAASLPIKSPGELVTLASIVEKETGKADERPRVAGVFINRLKRGMKLESDPTIVYGLVGGKGTLGHSITKGELEQPTQYNTYIVPGLPLGPIANPGKAALEAAANPAATNDLYFVADGTGGHAFSETFDQHLKNVEHWRQVEKDAKEAKDRLSPDLIPTTPPTAQPAGKPAFPKKGALDALDPKVFGALDALDPKVFGAVTPPTAPIPTAAMAALAARLVRVGAQRQKREAMLGAKGPLWALAARLAKVGAERQAREALLGPNGPLSTSAAGKSLADSGVVVMGVNDETLSETAAPEDAATPGPVQSYPLSAQALADQQSREARYGVVTASGKLASADLPPAPETARPPGARPRGFDASEGTPLDPLLNTTYDLNYPKTIPPIRYQ
jgi:UPF0755 protein